MRERVDKVETHVGERINLVTPYGVNDSRNDADGQIDRGPNGLQPRPFLYKTAEMRAACIVVDVDVGLQGVRAAVRRCPRKIRGVVGQADDQRRPVDEQLMRSVHRRLRPGDGAMCGGINLTVGAGAITKILD